MNNLPKILTLSFVGDIPESAAELHKQIQEELEPAATLETVAQQLTELADAHLIFTAEKSNGMTIYWRE